jgi:integral membrane protein
MTARPTTDDYPVATAAASSIRPSRLDRAFSVVAIAEAFSWAGLLIGMYFKHVAETTELGVRIFGSLHGALFVSYVALALALVARRHWSLRWVGVLALAAGVVPFASVVFARWARRREVLVVTPPLH